MATVAQMIEFFKTMPQDAEVECGVEVSRGYETYMGMSPVDIDGFSVYDYTSEEDRVKYPKMAGKTIIFINGV